MRKHIVVSAFFLAGVIICTVPQKLDTKTMFFVRPLNLIPARARGIVLQTLPA